MTLTPDERRAFDSGLEDVLLVACIAGISVAMIEPVYGHFRNHPYQEAQGRLYRERAARDL